MWRAKKIVGRLLGIILLLLLITPTSGVWGSDQEGGKSGNRSFGEETDKESKEDLKSKSNFVLTIKDNLVSLDAKNASLVEILEKIGSRIGITVLSNISEEQKVTIKFDNLPLKAAIERLREYADIVYI